MDKIRALKAQVFDLSRIIEDARRELIQKRKEIQRLEKESEDD